MNRSTTTAESRRPAIHNSFLCDCEECRETAATIAAWHVQGLLQMHSAESPVQRARRERRERRARRKAHRDAVFQKARRDPAFTTFMREARALMTGQPEPWGEHLTDEALRREILSWRRPGQGRCRIPLRPGGGTTLVWGPCWKPRCPDCIERVMEQEIAELTTELDGREAVVKRFPGRDAAQAYRRGSASRETVNVKGGRKVPGVRQFEVGYAGEIVLVFPAELRPSEPDARTGEQLGRALLNVYLYRVERLPVPNEDGGGEDRPRRPSMRHDVEPETVKMVAEERGMTFDYEERGRWTSMFFYGCTADDVDDLIREVNEMGADVLGNLAVIRAGP